MTVRVDTHLPVVDIERLLLGFRGEVLAFQTPVCYASVTEVKAAVLAVARSTDNCTGSKALVESVSSAGDPCSLQVTSQAVDECSNENTDTVTVRVDSEKPVVECSATVLPEDGGDDDKRLLIEFGATDKCGLESVSGVIETPCRDIPVIDGQTVELECDDDDGELEFENGILDIEATTATLVVTAEDECGNTATPYQNQQNVSLPVKHYKGRTHPASLCFDRQGPFRKRMGASDPFE